MSSSKIWQTRRAPALQRQLRIAVVAAVGGFIDAGDMKAAEQRWAVCIAWTLGFASGYISAASVTLITRLPDLERYRSRAYPGQP
jgi:hypothetical protein